MSGRETRVLLGCLFMQLSPHIQSSMYNIIVFSIQYHVQYLWGYILYYIIYYIMQLSPHIQSSMYNIIVCSIQYYVQYLMVILADKNSRLRGKQQNNIYS